MKVLIVSRSMSLPSTVAAINYIKLKMPVIPLKLEWDAFAHEACRSTACENKCVPTGHAGASPKIMLLPLTSCTADEVAVVVRVKEKRSLMAERQSLHYCILSGSILQGSGTLLPRR